MTTMPATGLPRRADDGQTADLVVRNDRIWTGDPTHPEANALAARAAA